MCSFQLPFFYWKKYFFLNSISHNKKKNNNSFRSVEIENIPQHDGIYNFIPNSDEPDVQQPEPEVEQPQPGTSGLNQNFNNTDNDLEHLRRYQMDWNNEGKFFWRFLFIYLILILI